MGAGGSTSPVVMIQDPDSGLRAAVETIGGKDRLLTDTNISSVNIPQGQDPIPDSYYTVMTAGAIGDTVRHQIAGTNNDTTSPDADMPAVDLTYILVAEDVGDEHALSHNIVTYLNSQISFQDAKLEAQVPDGDERPVVHITSTEFSLSGEFHERPNFGDVAISTTGTTVISIDSDSQKLVSRPKPTSLARDPNNPHRLGIIGIAGSIVITPGAVDSEFEADALDGIANDLAVNASPGSPAIYRIDADPDTDIFIQEMRFHGLGNGIKYGKFLNLNSTLTNGIIVEIQSNGALSTFTNIFSTDDLKARWSSKQGWELDIQAGGDHFLGIKDFNISALPVLKHVGANPGFPDDFIKVTIQDNLSQIGELFFTAIGFKDI